MNNFERIERPVPQVPEANMQRIQRPRRHYRHNDGNNNNGGGGLARTLYNVFDWGFYIALLPVTLPLRILTSAYDILALFLGLPRLPGYRRLTRRPQPPGPVDALRDVRLFREAFDEEFGSDHPNFHPGSYSQALDEAKKDLRFLVVFLHSTQQQESKNFCADVLCSEQFRQFVDRHNILVWGVSVESGEGWRVSAAMRDPVTPFIAVIVLRQSRMVIVGRQEGFMEAEDLVEKFERVIGENEAYVVAARADREERLLNQEIRRQQDEAFQETLAADREKDRKKKEEAEKLQREKEEEERAIREEQEKIERIRRLKVELVTEVPEEPAAEHPEAVRLLIKLPDGQRLERRFVKSQSLKALYYFVFCHPESPDEFDITTNFPRKVLKCKPEEEDVGTFEEAGLGKSTSLFVVDLNA